MKTLYLDLFSGISGDMFVAALIDLGVDAGRLEEELEKLGLDGYHLHVTRQHRLGIEGVRFDVHLEDNAETGSQERGHSHGHQHEGEQEQEQEQGQGQGQEQEHGHRHEHSHGHFHGQHRLRECDDSPTRSQAQTASGVLPPAHAHAHGRTFSAIRELLTNSPLSDWVREQAIAVFHRIAVAEGRIHGLPPDQVAFHEVGAVDSIIDIVGACIGLDMLGRPRLLASPVVEGTGWIECAHGRFPVPAPATLAILGARGIPVSQCDEPHEMVTPTGAALLAELVQSFGPMRNVVAEQIGFGLGARETESRPNALRAILGEAKSTGEVQAHDWETDTVMMLETNLDDISGEIVGHVIEKALAAGALDAFHSPIQMKKNRPGVLLTVLCAETDADTFTELLLRETTTLGVRRHLAVRRKLRRDFTEVSTPYGQVTVKLGRLDGEIVQVAPEYESCRQAAETAKVPLKQVYSAALEGLSLPLT